MEKAHLCCRLTRKTPRGVISRKNFPQWQSALKWGPGEVQPGSTPSGHTGKLPSPVLLQLTQCSPQLINQRFRPYNSPICSFFLFLPFIHSTRQLHTQFSNMFQFPFSSLYPQSPEEAKNVSENVSILIQPIKFSSACAIVRFTHTLTQQ